MNTTKHLMFNILIPLSIFILWLILWVTGILPSGLSILTANSYVHDHYSERGFIYRSIEYQNGYGDFVVRYVDKDGQNVSFSVSGDSFFITRDPLNMP